MSEHRTFILFFEESTVFRVTVVSHVSKINMISPIRRQATKTVIIYWLTHYR